MSRLEIGWLTFPVVLLTGRTGPGDPIDRVGSGEAERAAYVETAVAGQVFEDADIIAGLLTRFDTLRNEAFRGSESLALIERMCEEWTASGARAPIRVTTAGNA